MLWFGVSLFGGVMWSIVQSDPSSCLPQWAHRGSSTVLAYVRALIHAVLLCQSLIGGTPLSLFGCVLA